MHSSARVVVVGGDPQVEVLVQLVAHDLHMCETGHRQRKDLMLVAKSRCNRWHAHNASESRKAHAVQALDDCQVILPGRRRYQSLHLLLDLRASRWQQWAQEHLAAVWPRVLSRKFQAVTACRRHGGAPKSGL